MPTSRNDIGPFARSEAHRRGLAPPLGGFCVRPVPAHWVREAPVCLLRSDVYDNLPERLSSRHVCLGLLDLLQGEDLVDQRLDGPVRDEG